MTKRVSKTSKAAAALPAHYAPLLAEIKARVQSARTKAGLAANRELLALYWGIGRLILDRQRKEGWGAKVIDRLSADLQREFPGQQGFSPRNLKYMRAFAGAWPETAMVHQPVAQLGEPRKSEPAIVQAPLARTDRSAGAGEHRRSTAAIISEKSRFFSENPAVNGELGSIEWLPAGRHKAFIASMFLFE